MQAKLYFIYGSMGAGKTAMMLMKAYNFEEHGINVLCIKPSIDDRSGYNVIKSRIGISREVPTFTDKDNLFEEIEKRNSIKPLEWILADESQFFTPEQIDQLANVVDKLNINVICYGLRADFKTNLFPGSRRLFEIADTIEELKETCSCGKKAIVNARIDKDGNIQTEGEQVEIGGDEKYIAICRKCYNDKKH